jgi:hypothetical protein
MQDFYRRKILIQAIIEEAERDIEFCDGIADRLPDDIIISFLAHAEPGSRGGPARPAP